MAKKHNRRRKHNEHAEFHESLTTAAPDDYRTLSERDINVAAATSVAEQLLVALAVILSALLVVRFFTHMFSNNQAIGFVNFFNVATDWMAQPFQGLFQTVPAGTSGFFDIPAIAALVVVGALAYLLNRLLVSASHNDIV
jgi:uncharacterized protein YggT (Ycf19 family)